VTRSDDKRLDDILDVADEIATIVARGMASTTTSPCAGRWSGALGSSARTPSPPMTRYEPPPRVPWTEMIRLRDRLSHHSNSKASVVSRSPARQGKSGRTGAHSSDAPAPRNRPAKAQNVSR
jgi:hypothetical protein